MIHPGTFYDLLKENGIQFFTGVPDSLLKDFCAYVTDHTPSHQSIIAANEGGAAALAAGRYLAAGEISLVYMQNSGLGNTVNPLTSLIDPMVYSIPMLLLIGWRGEPGVKDEPQHAKQGKITLDLLETLGVEYEILPKTIGEAAESIKRAVQFMLEHKQPYALVVSKNTFEQYPQKNRVETSFELTREEAIQLVISYLDPEDVIVSTTGQTSREVFEYREKIKDNHEKDFLTVGSMGHSSQIALGIALAKPNINVYCLDGDGALIMHMGSLAIIGDQAPKNLKHVVLNNGAHDSVGGQPTAAFNMDIQAIARACGYSSALQAETREEIVSKISELKAVKGPSLLEIKVNKGARKDLGRPTTTPIENKEAFMKFLFRSEK